MQKARDEIIRNDPIYKGFTWESLEIHHLHDVCRAAIISCIEDNKALARRFNKLMGPSELQKKDEKAWLIALLETWFSKKWNTKRGVDLKKENGLRKRKANLCDCGDIMVCLTCDGRETKVRDCYHIDLDRLEAQSR